MIDQQGLYTLAEASELTGISTEALRLRIKRGKLSAERGNDGQPRVRITEAERQDFARLLARRQSTLTRQEPTLIRQGANNDNVVNVLEAAAAALHERAARAEAERNAARAEAAAERERADKAVERANRAEAEREAARIAAARAEGETVALRLQVQAERERVQAAEAARDGARTELADWTAGGPLGRAWRALIYRRGRP